MSIDTLIGKQNRDGGWPYVRGVSWTEPTVYAVLALLSSGDRGPAQRGLEWILKNQRPDGGSPPQAGIDESTWVTSLVALIPPGQLGAEAHRRAVRWLLGTRGMESTTTYRVREWLLGNSRPPEQEFPGWPWLPGTAAWVGPTSLGILALQKENRRHPAPELQRRFEAGQRFLITRMCHEGGWNHGSVRALGYESSPYPETTGMALLALNDVRSPEVGRALAVAHKFLDECRSADALNWLRLGLMAHGELPAGYCRPREVAFRTLPEQSLELLVSRAQQDRDLFWA